MSARGSTVAPLLAALLLASLLVLVSTAVQAQDPSPTVVARDRVCSMIEGMTIREKVGQLFMSRVYGDRADGPAPAARAANRKYLGVDDARELVERFGVGAIVYFEWTGDYGPPRKVAKLSNGIQQAALDTGTPPLLISTDQEHGEVVRLGPPATQPRPSISPGTATPISTATPACPPSVTARRPGGLSMHRRWRPPSRPMPTSS